MIKKIFQRFWQQETLLIHILTVIIAILGLFGILNHAMWRDELNGWLIARDSQFPIEFIQNIRYEGHPIFWYFCLFLLNQLTSNPLAMQLFHWLLGIVSIFLFLNYSPFNKIQKLLFCLGYLPFYEYLLISRNYALGLLFIILFACLFKTRHKSYLLLATILALMANTNAYCLCISFALCLMLIFENIFRYQLQIPLKASSINRISSLVIYSLGFIGSAVMLFPPTDSTLQGGATQWMLQFDWIQLTRTLSRIWNSYILILLPGDDQFFSLWFFAILSLALFIFVITSLIRKPVVLFFYVVATSEILLFTYIKFLGSPRHYGHLLLILILSWWLADYYAPSNWFAAVEAKLPRWWLGFVRQKRTIFISIILSAQLIAGIYSFSRDLLIPYSASRETARYIQRQNLTNKLWVGSEDFAVAPISAYLDRQIYYLETGRNGSYVLFSGERETLNQDTIVEKLNALSEEGKTPFFLILNHNLHFSGDQLSIRQIAEFPRAFIHNERYYLYKVDKRQSASKL